MSGPPAISLSALTALAEKNGSGTISIEENQILKDYGMLNARGIVKGEILVELSQWNESHDGAKSIMGLDSVGNLIVTGPVLKPGFVYEEDAEKIVAEAEKKRTEREADLIPTGPPLSLEEFRSSLESVSFEINIEDVKKVIAEYGKSLPRQEAYSTGEIKVYTREKCEATIHSIIAAGTLVLDAFLYMAMKEDTKSVRMFSVYTVKELSFEQITRNLSRAQKAFIACIVILYNRGSVPRALASDSSQERALQGILSNDLYGSSFHSTESDVAKELSCTTTAKFPGSLLLSFDTKLLPEKYYHRTKLSTAGSRVIRYAILASSCEKMPLRDPTVPMTAAENDQQQKLKLAQEILKKLAEQQGKHESLMRLHPLYPGRDVPLKFTLKCTCAILSALTNNGRKQLVEKITSLKLASFMKDNILMGQKSPTGTMTWPVLDSGDADYADLTVGILDRLFRPAE